MNELNLTSERNRRSTARRIPRNSVRFVCRKGALGLGRNILAKVGNICETGVSLHVTSLQVNRRIALQRREFSARSRLQCRRRTSTSLWLLPHLRGHRCFHENIALLLQLSEHRIEIVLQVRQKVTLAQLDQGDWS